MLSGLTLPSSALAGCKRVPMRQQRRLAGVQVFARDLTPEQQQAALERQLKRSGAKKSGKQPPAAKPAASAPAFDAEADLKKRQQEARAWITPWLEAAARKKSRDMQSQLRERVSMLSQDEEEKALKRLLYGKESGAQEAQAPKAAAAADEPQRLALGSPHTFEDGSLLFTCEMLQAVSYEDVLTA